MTGAIDPSFINPIYSGASLSDDITNTNDNVFGPGNDPTATNPVQSQAVVDAIHQSVHGGMATGNPASTVLTNLGQIPQANVAITPSNSTTVSFDAAGSWGTPVTTITSSATVTGTHVIGTLADYLLVMVPYTTAGVASISATCGSTPMAHLNTLSNVGIAAFGLANPPTGSQTITVSSPTITYLDAESTSLVGVASMGTIDSATNTHSNPSMTVGSDAGRLVTQMFFNVTSSSGSSAALSSYSQTQEVNTGSISAFGGNFSVLSGYAAGASSLAFTATAATTTNQTWYGLAVELRPSMSAEVGSGYRQWRSLPATLGASSGFNIFPSNFFDQNQYNTADITPVSGTPYNTVSVSYAGWYMVTLNCALASTSTNYYIRPVVSLNYASAGPYQQGATLYVSTTTANFAFGDAFIFYCNAGDTLTPGYWSSTIVTNLLTGESSGSESYWAVSLLNRSYM